MASQNSNPGTAVLCSMDDSFEYGQETELADGDEIFEDALRMHYDEKLEFDAPRFRDFDSVTYKKKLRAIEQVLFNQGTSSPYTSAASSDNEDIDWFQITHISHEPSVPPSPPTPLITPVITKRVGLGSPGRIVRSGDSTVSSHSSRSMSSNAGLSSDRFSGTVNRRLFNRHTHSPLRSSIIGMPAPVRREQSMQYKSPLAHQLHEYTLDECLSRSPSPPSLFHDTNYLELENNDVNMDRFSRRESYNLSDINLLDDELIECSTRTTKHDRHFAPKVTLRRPQRVLIEKKEELTPPNNFRRVIGSRLCPPPGHLPTNVPSVVGRVQKPSCRTTVQDIKRVLLEHNQRVRPRRE